MKKEIHCPKCQSTNINRLSGFGGFNCYLRLQCSDCKFEGGRVNNYTGEEKRIERELVERFVLNNKQDAVRAFVQSIV